MSDINDVWKDDAGNEYFDGFKVERGAHEVFRVLMDRVTWEGCPTLPGYPGPGLLLPPGYTSQQIRNSVHQFMLGVTHGEKLGRESLATDLRDLLGVKNAAS